MEQNFSTKALVNLALNYGTIMGEGCKARPTIYGMFLNIRTEAISRMHTRAHALKAQVVSPLDSYLNEQALSNLVSAYTKAHMINMDKYMLLQEVFNLEAFRVEQLGIWLQSGAQFVFRPQELCTLLRACCTQKAQPFKFLSNLRKLWQAHPAVIAGWSKNEHRELDRAFRLLHDFTVRIQQEVVLAQQQQQQQQQERTLRQQQQQQQQQEQLRKWHKQCAWQRQLQQQRQQQQEQQRLQQQQELAQQQYLWAWLSSLPQHALQPMSSIVPDLVASSGSMVAPSSMATSSCMTASSSVTANSSMAASSSMAMGLGQGLWQAGAGVLFAGEGAGLGGYTDLDAGLLGLYSTAAQTPTSLPVAQQQQHVQGSLGTLLQAQLLAQQDVLLQDFRVFQPADVSGTDPAGQLSAVSQGGKGGASRASFEEPSSDELSELAAVQSELLGLHLDSLVHFQPGQGQHLLPADSLPQDL